MYWTKYQEKYLFMELSTIYKVEHLKKYKSVENESKMSWVCSWFLEDSFIVRISIDEEWSSASYCTSYYSIVPFVLRMCCKLCSIIGINRFRDKVFTQENNDEDNDELIDWLSNNVFEHCLWDDVFVSWMWSSIEKTFLWIFSC